MRVTVVGIVLSLILLSPFGFFVALLLIAVGIVMGRPEILRLYIRPATLT
jgi:Na+-transporting NADH:ubiquinone oxidoreductase subunit NqrB